MSSRTFLTVILFGLTAGLHASVATFTSSGTWTVPANITSVDVLVVAGGGGGGSTGGGGGGGGGAISQTGYAVTPGASVTVTVGGGGSGGAGGAFNKGTNGGNSAFGSLTATGGGGGGTYTNANGNSGGSGGGSGQGGGTGGSGTSSQGNVGGNNTGGNVGGGGGGYGSAGGPSTANSGGSGLLYGGSYYAAGGGGGNGTNNAGAPGAGMGGDGSTAGTNADPNTGSGGGGGGSSSAAGGNGGSGIVIVTWGIDAGVSVSSDSVIVNIDPDAVSSTEFFKVQTSANAGGPTTLLTLTDAGNLGIGTTNPTQKLAVNGTIRAKEIIVDTGWSDFVFEPDYRLMPLAEVDAEIQRLKHLPGIPSAKDVARNGISLGDFQSKLLQKVEELTLYAIELKKENETQRRQIEGLGDLQQRFESLQSQLDALKAKE